MTSQVAPFLTQTDMLDPQTYKELGPMGAIFAISLLILVFCIVKGHVRIIGCGPNEGGIRELFGITLWAAGSGPHLHVAGIFAFRKVSFAEREIKLDGQVERSNSVYKFEIGVVVRVRRDKECIRRRVYQAEDLNRTDAENDEAIAQLTGQLLDITRQVLQMGIPPESVQNMIKDFWGQIELDEIHGVDNAGGRSTYGYEIRRATVKMLVEREQSEIARALRGTDLDRSVISAVPSLSEQMA